ncbi:MAG: hypothetical protein AB7T37_02270 [Dehalococcoidia bacterium]
MAEGDTEDLEALAERSFRFADFGCRAYAPMPRRLGEWSEWMDGA